MSTTRVHNSAINAILDSVLAHAVTIGRCVDADWNHEYLYSHADGSAPYGDGVIYWGELPDSGKWRVLTCKTN